MAIRITEIPATMNRFTADPIENRRRRRAAAYARVSSDHEDQRTSCAAQVGYYTDLIQSHTELIFVNVYIDEGITGTSTSRREGFKRMIADAVSGKIDIIITKSVSRFARNTVDSLSTIRLLKEHGVECYFEKENIRTFDSKGELLLTIMSSLAQEESRSISENCTWGQRKRFADGKVTVPFSRFLGYDRGGDGNLIVNEKEAETVRRIYEMFLQGDTPYTIAKKLTEDGIPSPGGKKKWYKNTVASILSNEKYKGDALLQKVFTVDYLTKRKRLNRGELPQYYVEGSHEPIISAEIYEQVQEEFDKRRHTDNDHAGTEIFLSRIICGECGCYYSPRIWYSTNNYRKVIWQCRRKNKNSGSCTPPHLVEAEIKLIFMIAVNKRISAERPDLMPIEEFSEELWRDHLDHITVFDKNNVLVTFKDGAEIRVGIGGMSALPDTNPSLKS